MPKRIGVFGVHPEDVCLYTAFALQNMGKRVGVVDNSIHELIFHAIPSPDAGLETVTCRNVDFMKQVSCTQWENMSYDFLLVQLEMEPEEMALRACDELVLIVDCEKANLDYYREQMQAWKRTMLVLLRDICPDGFSVKKMKEYFERGNCFIDKWLTLLWSEDDLSYRIRLQYETVRKFARISPGMETVVLQLLRWLLPQEAAHAARAVKAAKKGRVL